eukprot:21539-Heterococcus_DN1.PRE.4
MKGGVSEPVICPLRPASQLICQPADSTTIRPSKNGYTVSSQRVLSASSVLVAVLYTAVSGVHFDDCIERIVSMHDGSSSTQHTEHCTDQASRKRAASMNCLLMSPPPSVTA